MEHSQELPGDIARPLRTLIHDLSNSLETILQASYLLAQVPLDAKGKELVRMIDSASQDAARVNREIREILRSQS
jgi:signal transduction histidine kinase